VSTSPEMAQLNQDPESTNSPGQGPAPARSPVSLIARAGAAVGSSSGASEPPQKPHFPPPAELPTQLGPDGLRFDFNFGARVAVPEAGGPRRIRLSDLDTGNVLYETTMQKGWVHSAKRYYMRTRIEAFAGDRLVLAHDYDCRDKEVLIQLPVGTLGDSVGWFSYAVKFKRAHGCRLSVAMAEAIIPLFRDAYPEIAFLSHDEVDPKRYYATYNIGLYFDDEDRIHQPCDFRLVGLHRTAGYILGVDPTEEAPRIAPSRPDRPIPERYVCIAAQSTTQAKYWNNPFGWREIVRFLNAAGYRVVCIDRSAANGQGLIWNHMPHGVLDETGARPLQERARWLMHADFFIGLSSGLSWLAWAAGTPVVMISGFTHPTNEFATPYRVINYHACNSCWNDVRVKFDHKDYLWCPRHKDTPRQFECTRLITAEQVKDAIRRIPGFGEGASAPAACAV
jgi:autotransporter strand-loop-strand O-heptosyltransferase